MCEQLRFLIQSHPAKTLTDEVDIKVSEECVVDWRNTAGCVDIL